jgi:hypothetical protein
MYIFDGMKNSLRCEGLESWVAGARIPENLYARMIAHPAYPAAARALAANMMAAGDSNKALDGIFKDAGRYLAAMLAMYLHVSGGLTLPRLKEICAATGFLSPGRARALLIYMRYLGYVVPVAGRARGEPARYQPTESFIASWRKHVRAALGAAQMIDADVGFVLSRLDEDAVLERFARIQGEGLLASAQGADQSLAVLRVFVHRHAGTQVIWAMLLADDEAFPPAKPIRQRETRKPADAERRRHGDAPARLTRHAGYALRHATHPLAGRDGQNADRAAGYRNAAGGRGRVDQRLASSIFSDGVRSSVAASANCFFASSFCPA